MNLIEQLGGYEKAKEILSRERNSENIDPVIYLNGNEILIDAICDALLEYRRQHNIFEIDDYVVFVDEKERKPVLLKFKESRNFDLVHLEIIGSGLCGPSYQKEIRHATDAEIKAGKRLEVNDGNSN